MKKSQGILLLLLAGLFSPSTLAQSIKIGTIKQKNLPHECGCTLWMLSDYRPANQIAKRRVVFFSELTDYRIMNFDGKDVRLELDRESPHTKERAGSHSWQEYKRGEIKVRIDFVATKVCPARDESCELIYYNANIRIARGVHKTLARAKGFCGC